MAIHNDAGVVDRAPSGVGAKSSLTSTAHIEGHGSPFVTAAKSGPFAATPTKSRPSPTAPKDRDRTSSFGRCS